MDFLNKIYEYIDKMGFDKYFNKITIFLIILNILIFIYIVYKYKYSGKKSINIKDINFDLSIYEVEELFSNKIGVNSIFATFVQLVSKKCITVNKYYPLNSKKEDYELHLVRPMAELHLDEREKFVCKMFFSSKDTIYLSEYLKIMEDENSQRLFYKHFYDWISMVNMTYPINVIYNQNSLKKAKYFFLNLIEVLFCIVSFKYTKFPLVLILFIFASIFVLDLVTSYTKVWNMKKKEWNIYKNSLLNIDKVSYGDIPSLDILINYLAYTIVLNVHDNFSKKLHNFLSKRLYIEVENRDSDIYAIDELCDLTNILIKKHNDIINYYLK